MRTRSALILCAIQLCLAGCPSGENSDDEDAFPTITLTSPADGTSVTGTVTIQVTASDDKGIQAVEFEVDSVQIADVTTSPYSTSWDSTSVYNGSHTILARVVDTATQTAESSVTINVANTVTTDCLWTPLICSSGASSGCSCTRSCESHNYIMDCSQAGECTCTMDGAQTTTTTTTCGDKLTLATSFTDGCGYPNVAPGVPPATACVDATPFQFYGAPGCTASKSCEGHRYNLRCPSGSSCFCEEDYVWTGAATANCSDANSVISAFSDDCGFPPLQ